MGRFVIVAYTPKPGKDQQLVVLVKKHIQVLKAENLVSDKPAYLMRSSDGTVVEVFEWRSTNAVSEAHSNAAVQALWEEFADVCDYTPLTKLKEAHEMFAEFDAL